MTRFGFAMARMFCAVAMLAACSSDESRKLAFAKYPTVTLEPSGLPTYAVGDTFSFDNPKETWTVRSIQNGLISWESSRGQKKTTAFDPFLPPLLRSGEKGAMAKTRLIRWQKSLFPLRGGQKIAFKAARLEKGQTTATAFEWKCYSGEPRNVTVKAGSFPAYPVFCRRSDDLTVQSFYAPKINTPLMITTRKRPAPGTTRELVNFKLADGQRIAAAFQPGLPTGWAKAAPTPVAKSEAPRDETIAAGPSTPAPANEGAISARSTETPHQTARETPAAVAATVAQTKTPPAENGRNEPKSFGATPAPAAIPAITSPPPKPPQRTPPKTPTSSRKATVALANPPRETDLAPPAPARRPAPEQTTGPFGVQIASFRKTENLEPAWFDFERRFRPLLTNVVGMVQKADFGGKKGVFHRLIAGPFTTRAKAEVFCRAIGKRGANCFVLTIPH